MGLPILVLDFDGTVTTYASGWQGIDVCPDPPTPGFEQFLEEALPRFEIHIFGARSGEAAGREAMQRWCSKWVRQDLRDQLHFPEHKPPAFLMVDDRAVTFTGTWPTAESLAAFRPWTNHTTPPYERPRRADDDDG